MSFTPLLWRAAWYFCSYELLFRSIQCIFLRPEMLIVYIQFNDTWNKGSARRRICILCQKTSLKRWFGNINMTSNCDVTNSAHQIEMAIVCHWRKFSAYATEGDSCQMAKFLLQVQPRSTRSHLRRLRLSYRQIPSWDAVCSSIQIPDLFDTKMAAETSCCRAAHRLLSSVRNPLSSWQ